MVRIKLRDARNLNLANDRVSITRSRVYVLQV